MSARGLRLLGLGCALGATLLITGCPDNQSACLAYHQALSAARTECGIQPTDPEDPLIDEEVLCPASLNHGADCVDHYLTLRDGVTCDGTNVTFQQVESGPPPGQTNGCF